MHLKDSSGIIPPTGEPVVVAPHSEPLPGLRVTKVGEVGSVAGPSELASPSLMTVPEPAGASFGLSFLLQRGDDEVTLGRGDLNLQGVEEFKVLPSRDQWRMLKNEILRVNSN